MRSDVTEVIQQHGPTVRQTKATILQATCAKPLGHCTLPEHLNPAQVYCYCNNSYDYPITDRGLTSGQPQKPVRSDCGCLVVRANFKLCASSFQNDIITQLAGYKSLHDCYTFSSSVLCHVMI